MTLNVAYTPEAHPGSTAPLALLSRGLVQLLRHRAGRGPTKAKAFWAGDEAVLVLFGGGYTKAEETLWLEGRSETAMTYRRAVFGALEDDMRAVVEAAIERPVSAVLSCAHHDPDVMAAVFLLEPLGGSGSPDAGDWRGAGGPPAPPPTSDGAA